MSSVHIEKVKSVLLVVLFLSTILLLYFFWENISINKIAMPQDPIEIEKQEIPQSMDVAQPSRITVSFGAENYTVIPFSNKDIWFNSQDEKYSIIEEFSRFGQTENILVMEINQSQFIEVMKESSINAEFFYPIPFADFCEQYEIRKPQSYDAIENISSIGYSVGSPNSLFIYDGKNRKYYILIADSDNTDTLDSDLTNFSELISSIESMGYNPYYPLSVFLGVNNSALIPLDIESKMRSFSFRQDSYIHQVDKINEMAESFFGESFDFVRKITEDNGTIIYMYGYGQKVLIVNTDGSFEYKEELLNENNSDQKYFEALETALQFVAVHGSWKSLDGAKLTPYLKNVEMGSDKKKSYRFTFGMVANGVPIFYEQGESIIIDVTMGQVTYYKRNMIDFDQEELDEIETLSTSNTFTAVNMIAQNFELIYEILLENNVVTEITDKNQIFEEVSNHISNMQIGYMKPEFSNTSENQILPAWIVSIDNIKIFFDLYNAEPLGYSHE